MKHVSRIDPNSVTDLSGRWNDTDSRLVANALIEQSMQNPWARVYMDAHGGQAPAVIVGSFRNQTMEHIPVNTFISDLERAFINSGMVRLVASPQEREEVRAE
ncbi:MAG: penicillin-binding protein activator LpoB, partial [Gemmatimonadota bacterium]